MRYLVTGGAGFIGSAIVHELVKRGEAVRVLDNLSTGHHKNLAEVEACIEFINGDIADDETVRAAAESVDYVLHQAALPSVPRSIADPLASHRANADGTLHLLCAARDAKVRRVVYASSSSVYGDTPTLPKSESIAPNPLSPYAVSKLTGEYYCRVFTHVYGLETVALRYFNVFGPRQNLTSPYSGVLSLFINALHRAEQPVVFGDGEQSRDFTYVSEVVEANLLATTAPDASGKVLNIGSGNRYTLNSALALLGQIIGTRPSPVHKAVRPGDVRHSLADISQAQRYLGYKPRVRFEEGLRRTVEWFRNESCFGT